MARYELTDTIAELLDVEVRERGVNAMLRCPFHEDRHPSFSIHLNEGVWYCFSCGRKGNLDKLYRLLGEEMSDELRYDRIIRSLDTRPRERVDFTPIANHCIRDRESGRGQALLHSYLESRGIARGAIDAFGLGYSQAHDAISFPYIDDEIVTGIKYRLQDGGKRAETKSHFGIYAVENARGKQSVVVAEGESDTLSVWSHLPQKVGVCGLSGAKHDTQTWELWALDFLFAERVYLALDADEPGDSGAETAMKVLGDKAIRLRPTRGNDMSEHLMSGGTLRELGMEEEDLGV